MKKIKIILLSLLCLIAFTIAGCKGKDDSLLNTQHSISINRSEIVMEVGDEFTLVAVCGDSTVLFETDDSNVVTVDENGKIIAIGEGEAFVTAKAEGKHRSCKVTVVSPKYELVLDKSDKITVAKNTLIEITATLLRNGEEKQTEISWSVTNESSCYLQANGNVCRFESQTQGEYVITAKSDKAICAITITVIDK